MFIEYVTEGRSTRDKELLDSKARSHAARWAHRRSQLTSGHHDKKRKGKGDNKSSDERSVSSPENELESVRRPSLVTSSSRGSLDSKKGRSSLASPTSDAIVRRAPSQDLQYGSAIASPVQSYPIPLDSNSFRSFEYFPELWSRWAADVIPRRADRLIATQAAVSSIVQRCLTDELHRNAFISYVLQRAPTVKISKIFLVHTAGKALADLRNRIEGGAATIQDVVWPIIFLAHYELFGSKSVGAGRAHLKAVVELGGFEYLDEVTKFYITRLDRGWWSDYESIFPPMQSPTAHLEKLVPEIPDADVAGSGFLEYRHLLGFDLISIMPAVVDCVRAGILCRDLAEWGSEDEVMQNKVIRKCQTSMDTLRQRLPAGHEQTACIYPAMIWLQYMTWVMRDLATQASSSVDAYRNITRHAHANLLRSVQQSSQAPELVLWAAMVGIATSPDEAVRVQYATCVIHVAGELQATDLRSILKKYIWFEILPIIDYSLIQAAFSVVIERDQVLRPTQLDLAHQLP
jgi:hypothetical protein